MENLKAIAIYLPQYHQVKENDEWWGDNYTEWTAVRKAERLYEGHEQPRVPLNNNYYDLMHKETMQWQAELAKEYGIYGFCFYHYYFKDGRKILERPAENLLKWKDIEINYCFSWANESWVRTWGKISGGSMASKFEKYGVGEAVLLQQQYGDAGDWKAHFDYLLPFFRDERYIKIDGKPVFIFHVPEIIDCLERMVEVWRNLAEKNGFPGIYLIGVITDSYREYPALDALYAHEPRLSFNDYIQYSDDGMSDICNRYNFYKDICEWSNLRKYYQKQKIFYGAFVGFDSTPRHGKRGVIIDKVTPSIFEDHFRDMCNKSHLYNNEFVFINAWNEWGEGNYLEPDEKFGYAFLEKVQKIIGESDRRIIADIEKDSEKEFEMLIQIISEREAERDKFKSYFKTFDQWMLLMERGISIEEYLKKNQYQKVAIYGFGSLGKHLFGQLKASGRVEYIIDQKVNIINFPIPFYTPTTQLPEVDIIIVTVISEFNEISELLRGRVGSEIISLNEIIKECL